MIPNLISVFKMKTVTNGNSSYLLSAWSVSDTMGNALLVLSHLTYTIARAFTYRPWYD